MAGVEPAVDPSLLLAGLKPGVLCSVKHFLNKEKKAKVLPYP